MYNQWNCLFLVNSKILKLVSINNSMIRITKISFFSGSITFVHFVASTIQIDTFHDIGADEYRNL